MKAEGNGSAQTCAYNLLSMVRGEVPYDRLRGMDAGITDAPMTTAFGRVAENVNWVLKYYEPRASTEDTSLLIEDVVKGKFKIAAAVATGG